MPPESVLETRLLALIDRRSLPRPSSQWVVRDHGRFVARLDFAYPQHRIALEADGYRWHGDVVQWRADLARRNELTRLGWRVLHFTWDDVHRRAEYVARTIERALRSQSPEKREVTTKRT